MEAQYNANMMSELVRRAPDLPGRSDTVDTSAPGRYRRKGLIIGTTLAILAPTLTGCQAVSVDSSAQPSTAASSGEPQKFKVARGITSITRDTEVGDKTAVKGDKVVVCAAGKTSLPDGGTIFFEDENGGLVANVELHSSGDTHGEGAVHFSATDHLGDLPTGTDMLFEAGYENYAKYKARVRQDKNHKMTVTIDLADCGPVPQSMRKVEQGKETISAANIPHLKPDKSTIVFSAQPSKASKAEGIQNDFTLAA